MRRPLERHIPCGVAMARRPLFSRISALVLAVASELSRDTSLFGFDCNVLAVRPWLLCVLPYGRDNVVDTCLFHRFSCDWNLGSCCLVFGQGICTRCTSFICWAALVHCTMELANLLEQYPPRTTGALWDHVSLAPRFDWEVLIVQRIASCDWNLQDLLGSTYCYYLLEASVGRRGNGAARPVGSVDPAR